MDLDKVNKSQVKPWCIWSGQLEENNKAVSSVNNEVEDWMDSAPPTQVPTQDIM